MKDITTGLYLSEAFYDLALSLDDQEIDSQNDWLDASTDEDDELENEGYGVMLLFNEHEILYDL